MLRSLVRPPAHEAAASSGTWMGRPIDGMTREELVAALAAAASLVRSSSLVRPDFDLRESSHATVLGRAFKWAFLPAGHIWSDADRAASQARLDAFAGEHGLDGAVVRFGADRLDVEVPRRLQAEQVMALQEWLEREGEALDVSQVP